MDLNREAYSLLRCPRQLDIVPGATHLFSEPGALEEVARLAEEWFLRYLVPAPGVRARPLTAAGPLVSGGSPMIPIKTILHPTDFSKPVGVRVTICLRLARDYQARLLLLHVVEPPVYYGELGMAVPLPADFHESLLERLSRLVPVECGILVETILVEGNASQQILRIAEEPALRSDHPGNPRPHRVVPRAPG